MKRVETADGVVDGGRNTISRVHVRVPATSANLGAGFDCFGLALDYCDELIFTRRGRADGGNQGAKLADKGDHDVGSMGGAKSHGNVDGTEDVEHIDGVESSNCVDTSAKVIIHGEGESTLPRDETHLVVSTFRRACRIFGLPRFGFMLEAHNRIPQARGLGSSAEAIVAGIAAAAAFAGAGIALDRDSIFALAAGAEGHPDNVAPAVYGGLTASWKQEAGEGVGSLKVAGAEPAQTGFHTVGYPVSHNVRATVFVPDVELSTERARLALPAKVPYSSATHNVSRAALLPAAMNCADTARGNQLLFAATQDMLHQPYRKSLMAPSWDLIEALRSQGFAAAVSGAGPCVLVLHYGHGASSDAQIDAVAASQLNSGHWRVLHLPVSAGGVSVEVK